MIYTDPKRKEMNVIGWMGTPYDQIFKADSITI